MGVRDFLTFIFGLQFSLLQPRARSHHMVLSIDDVERVASIKLLGIIFQDNFKICLLYTSPSPRDRQKSRMPSSA